MKTVYIPRGETVSYESLATERLIVDGCLKTAYGVKAKIISGDGAICAGTIAADLIRAGDLEADAIICERLIAKRVEAPEVFASESALVSCYLSAAYVETGRLTVSISEVDTVNADEVVNLRRKSPSLFGALILSELRAFWARITEPMYPAMDADYEAEENASAGSESPADTGAGGREAEPVDEELNRFVNMFKLARESGFTLRIVPGTPEENAPVFDFEKETIVPPAA